MLVRLWRIKEKSVHLNILDSDAIREKLRNENFILREKLKVLNKPVEESDNKKLVSQYLGGMKHASRHLK